MQTIAVFNTRGGSGKSAVTVFLADFLSTAFKKRLLVVDLDPQQSSSVALLGDEWLYNGFRQGKSLPRLLRRYSEEDLRPNDVLHYTIERPKPKERKGTLYLGPLRVLACEREDWDDLDHDLGKLPDSKRPLSYPLLRRLLKLVDSEFDICLIDFPGHETGPITKNGLRAADWWLFPCVPDRAGIRNIQRPVATIEDAYRGSKRRIRRLGTLLSISQPANSLEYIQSFQALAEAAETRIIPRLFGDKAKLLIWIGARNALDDTLWGEKTTLKQKYKEKPLYDAVRSLCHEALQRMDIPDDEAPLDPTLLDEINDFIRKVFIRARAKSRPDGATAGHPDGRAMPSRAHQSRSPG
jgi:chromosome partitioning protein